MKYQLDCAIWELTLECNLNCSHCGSSAGLKREDELSTKECFQLCEELAELCCGNVALMGGEPFMRNDWFQIGECIRDLGMDLSIVSNGILLEEEIDKISQVDPLVVGLSLDGLEETHDSIRNKGSFKSVMNAMELLRKRKIQTTIISTVSKTNFKELPKLKDLIYKKKANWQIQIAAPFGNFNRELMVTEEEYYAVALFIAKQRIKTKFDDLPVVGAHCFGYNSKILPGCHSWKGCTAGIGSIGITSNGGIVGCLSMGNNRFIEGNVRKENLKKIWRKENNFKYNRGFKTKNLGENCINCKYGEKCKGGCNSMSYSITDKFNNDPYCFYRLEKDVILKKQNK